MTDKILLNSTNGKMLLIQMNLSLGIYRVPLDITITSRKGSYITVMSLISLALTLCSHASSHPFAKSRSMISKVSGTVLHQRGYKLASYSLHCTHHGSPDQPEIFHLMPFLQCPHYHHCSRCPSQRCWHPNQKHYVSLDSIKNTPEV